MVLCIPVPSHTHGLIHSHSRNVIIFTLRSHFLLVPTVVFPFPAIPIHVDNVKQQNVRRMHICSLSNLIQTYAGA